MADYNPSTDTVETLSALTNADFLAVNPNASGDAKFSVYSGSSVQSTILGNQIQINRQTLSAALTLTSASAVFQLLDPNGANRNVDLPTGATNLRFKIENVATSGTAFNLVVRNAGGSTVATLPPQYAAEFLWDGTTWQFYVIQNPANVLITGGVATLTGDLTLSGAATIPQIILTGPNRSVIFQPTGNNLGIEYRNALSGGIIYTDWSVDAGSDFHLRFSLNSATDARVVGAAGLTWRLQLPVSLEGTTTTVSALTYTGQRATTVISGNTTLDSTHIGRKLIVTAAADLTLPSTLGAQGNEIEIVIATSGTVRLVQGASASIKWHNGSSTQTGTRTFLGDGVISQVRFTGAGAVCIDGGVS